MFHIQETLKSEVSLIFRHSINKDFLALTKREKILKGSHTQHNYLHLVTEHRLTSSTCKLLKFTAVEDISPGEPHSLDYFP
jgi:hypothetical protein